MSLTEHLGQQKYLGPSGRLQQRRDAQRRITKEKTRQKATQARKRPIRRRSKKMTKLMEYYRERKALFLAKHPLCVACESKLYSAQDIHHKRGVTGTLRLDERFWVPLCRSHHCFVTDEPKAARSFGLLCESGDWDKAPYDEETRRLKQLIKEICK